MLICRFLAFIFLRHFAMLAIDIFAASLSPLYFIADVFFDAAAAFYADADIFDFDAADYFRRFSIY